MNKNQLTQTRIVPALVIAIAADAIQLPINALTLTGFLAIPAETVDVLVDLIAMGATMMLLGFHWLLLPSLILELIPGLDILPGWTACVAFVLWQRSREQWTLPVVEVQDLPPKERKRLKRNLNASPLKRQIVSAADPLPKE